MKTHLSFDGWCLRSRWCGRTQRDDVFVSHGRLVNPNGHFDGCRYVSIYHRPGVGYGYEEQV